uniref:Putative secreted peptide n=1 Tax=Anopheles braziliensis TaxID=58242 RepID=A0A2M3ZTW9_9DIPT
MLLMMTMMRCAMYAEASAHPSPPDQHSDSARWFSFSTLPTLPAIGFNALLLLVSENKNVCCPKDTLTNIHTQHDHHLLLAISVKASPAIPLLEL